MSEIHLVDHDPAWRERFAGERDRLRTASDERLLGVFHIGSTAVEDLAAKPVVDVLAVYEDYVAASEAADALVEWGYDRRRDDPDWLVLTRTEVEPVVVHLRPRSADAWRDHLVFREFLRENPGARAEYERAKREAAAAHPDDVAAYTDAKNEKIRSLEARAYEEGYGERVPTFDETD
ncbi:GrpB family protein [Halorussus sp. AFM4]|uniref:GrpB family protein n=1 Tax=Halorussus sp. AFM4 TaxID=3421651 RepID=UPI003EBF726C